jgi:hypothetical protein
MLYKLEIAMAKNSKSAAFKEWFVAERARSLAAVFLTRRRELDLEDSKEETGLDFHVRIVHDHRPTGKSFGVLLRGAMSPVTEANANKVLRSTVASFGSKGPFHYPVCLFFFTMRDDQGYSTWLLEPVITDPGIPKLIHRTEPDCRKLDDNALDHIIATVDTWYDVLLAGHSGFSI